MQIIAPSSHTRANVKVMATFDQLLIYKHRVVFSLLRASARVGLRLGLPVKQMRELMNLAYFREAREEQDLKLDEIAHLFDTSLRTVSSQHRRFRADFFAPEDAVALRRAIAALVNHAPATRPRLIAAFPETPQRAMDAALADLIEGGTVSLDEGRYRRNPDAHSFIDPKDLHSRIDGLNRQMDVLAATVWCRFVTARGEGEPDPGGARTLVFRSTDDDFAQLVADLESWLTERAIASDAACSEEDPGTKVGITFAATPMEET